MNTPKVTPYDLPDTVKSRYEPFLQRVIFRDDDFRRVESGLIAFDTRLRVAEHASAPGAKTARNLYETARRLFDFAKANRMEESAPHAIAAVDYLVTESDHIPDFSTDNSFHDDQCVLDAVILHFKLREKI